MYPGRTLTLTSMIGRINRTLNFANQVIPLYMKAKPMVKNAKEAFKVAKVFMEKPKTSSSNTTKIIETPIKKVETKISTNKPVFFQ